MSVVADVVGVIAGSGIIGALSGLLTVRGTNKKLAAQTHKLNAEEIDILTGAATDLVAPLRATLTETRAELAETKNQVKQLTAEVEHQRLVINESTVKLEAANKRADQATARANYYQSAFDARASTEDP